MPAWAWSPGGISRTRSTTPEASRNASTDGSGPLMYEAASVMLTRYKGLAQTQGLGLRDRQAINDAQGARRSCSSPRNHHARQVRNETEFTPAQTSPPSDRRTHRAPARSDARGREQTTAPIALHAANQRPTAISTKPPCTQLTPSSARERIENAGIPRRRYQKSLALDSLENTISSLPTLRARRWSGS